MDLVLVVIELILADLVLGGDNAIVISLVTKNLQEDMRLKASLYGAMCAILLRIVFIVLVVLFGEQHIAFLNIIAGAFLVNIAIDLICPKEESHDIKASTNLKQAVKTIVIADAVMSFDNAVVIASIVQKANVSLGSEIILIAFALLVSFPIILFGARLLTKIIEKFSIIVYICGFVIIHIGIELASNDSLFNFLQLQIGDVVEFCTLWALTIIVFGLTITYIKRAREMEGHSIIVE